MSSSAPPASSPSGKEPGTTARILEVHLVATAGVRPIEITEEACRSCSFRGDKPIWARGFTVDDARHFLAEHYDPAHLCIPEMFDLYPMKEMNQDDTKEQEDHRRSSSGGLPSSEPEVSFAEPDLSARFADDFELFRRHGVPESVKQRLTEKMPEEILNQAPPSDPSSSSSGADGTSNMTAKVVSGAQTEERPANGVVKVGLVVRQGFTLGQMRSLLVNEHLHASARSSGTTGEREQHGGNLGSGTSHSSKRRKLHKCVPKHGQTVQQLEATLANLGPSFALPPFLADMLRESPEWKLRKGVTLKLNLQRRIIVDRSGCILRRQQDTTSGWAQLQHEGKPLDKERPLDGGGPLDELFHLGTVVREEKDVPTTYELYVNLDASKRRKFGSVSLYSTQDMSVDAESDSQEEDEDGPLNKVRRSWPAPFEVFARFLETSDLNLFEARNEINPYLRLMQRAGKGDAEAFSFMGKAFVRERDARTGMILYKKVRR
ncbi:unnamed protein product [Amoebophrya sp. A25]|nr:unnamed protein product [Amoebophrya sp. A25]|eukprot:GSA25T00007412001.1